MKTKIVAGNNLALNTGATAYDTVSGECPWNTTVARTYQLCAPAGTIRKLRIELSAAPGAGKSWVFSLYKNGVITALSVTIADLATSGNDVDDVALAAGDYTYLEAVPSGTPAASYARWSWEFESTEANQTPIWGQGGPMSISLARYFGLSQSYYYYAASGEASAYSVAPCAGTLKNFYVKLAVAGGAGTYTFTIRKNAVDTTLVVAINDPATTGSDLVNTVAVAAGDYFSIRCTPTDSPTVATAFAWGAAFEPTIADEQIIMSGLADQQPSTAATNFNFIQDSTGSEWNATETNRHQLVQAMTIKKLFVKLSAAPGAGNSWQFRVYKNGVATTLLVTINDPATTGSDLVNSFDCVDDDELSLESIPTSGPTATYVAWGVVGYPTAAPSGPANLSEYMGVAKAAIAEINGVAIASISQLNGVA